MDATQDKRLDRWVHAADRASQDDRARRCARTRVPGRLTMRGNGDTDVPNLIEQTLGALHVLAARSAELSPEQHARVFEATQAYIDVEMMRRGFVKLGELVDSDPPTQ